MMTLRREDLQKPPIVAVLFGFSIGLLIHLFGLTEPMYNHDSIAVYIQSYGAAVTSGRWFLGILAQILLKQGLCYSLFTVNGLLFLAELAIASGLIVSALRIRSRVSAALMGILFVTFPSVASAMYYRFTVPPYGLSVILAALAVWVLPKGKLGILYSAVCIAFSMGIYQAYIPLTISMFVLLLIQQALAEETSDPKLYQKLILRGLYECAALLLGVGLYFLLSKACLRYYSTELTTYKGINNMGRIVLSELPGMVLEAFRDVAMLPTADYCGLANIPPLRMAYLLIYLLSAGMVGIILKTKTRNLLTSAAVIVLLLIFPVAVNFIKIMCGDMDVYTLMLSSFSMIACMPLVIFEQLPQGTSQFFAQGKKLLRKLLCLVLAILIFCYGYYTNMSYTTLHHTTRQCEQYINSMVVQVRMTEGFRTDMEWAFLGNIDDPLLHFHWYHGNVYGGSDETYYMLLNAWPFWLNNHSGYNIPQASQETVTMLSQTEEVKAMPCWPNEGSVKIIDDRVVIKFQELAQ